MFNTAWTDFVLKVGGQILLAVLIILAVTFGADPLFPKKNMTSMIASRAEQGAKTNTVAAKTNTVAAKTNTVAAKTNGEATKTNGEATKTNGEATKKNTVVQTNASNSKSSNVAVQTNAVVKPVVKPESKIVKQPYLGLLKSNQKKQIP